MGEILTVIIILAVVGIIALLVNGVEDYRSRDPLTEISFARDIDKVELPIITLINNNQSFNFLVDTGSSESLLDDIALPKFKYAEVKGKGTAYGIDGTLNKVKYAVMDLTHGSETFREIFQVMRVPAFDNVKESDGVEIVGILGSNFLRRYNFTIDYMALLAIPHKIDKK